MKNIDNYIKAENTICIRGSYSRGEADKYSDYDFLLLQTNKDDKELKELKIALKKKFINYSIIRYSLGREKKIDLLKLISLNSMIYFCGNIDLFRNFKSELKLLLYNLTFKELFNLLESDIYSRDDVGQYHNLKNGVFSTLRLEFCDLINQKRPKSINTKFYRRAHVFIRRTINNYYNCNAENSKDFERLLLRKSLLYFKAIFKLILYRFLFVVHLCLLKQLIIFSEYENNQ